MTELIGKLIADWPSWMIFPAAVVAAALMIMGYSMFMHWEYKKKEWWQDRAVQSKKNQTKGNNSKLKTKKG